MKRLIFGCIAMVCLLSSCNKNVDDHNLPREEQSSQCTEYFRFGYSGGLMGVHKFFVIKNGHLYPEDTTKPALSNAKYHLAKTLIEDFPDYLRACPDTTFGCMGCADQFTIGIRSHEAGVAYFWNMDMDNYQLPVELQAYVQEVYDVTEAL